MNIGGSIWQMVKWRFLKRRLGLSKSEFKEFKDNPRNVEIVSKAPTLMKKTIVAEVVSSNACNSEHKVGDKLYFDGFGNLLTERCPKRVCCYAISAVTPQIFAANELFYAGINPNDMRFKHAGCFDVGLACGGIGRIAMKISVEEVQKKSAKRLEGNSKGNPG